MNLKERLNWCRGKMRWSVNGDWDNVIFTDKGRLFGVEIGGFTYGDARMKPSIPIVRALRPNERSVL